MRRHYATLALVLTLGAATAAFAQGNPTGRGSPDRDPFGQGSITTPAPRVGSAEDFGRSRIGQSGMGRATPRSGGAATVTPVPEPGQWAMMLAGLALVGWIVRRNAKR